MTRREHPIAFATSASFRIEARKASFEKGRTMPDVPMIEIPPMIPNFGLNVRAANSFPPGTEIVTTTSFILPDRPFSSSIVVNSPVIRRRGVALMAGPPISRPRPGSVTVPTPSPARNRKAGVGDCPACNSIRAITEQPFVTSGSSPESFITVHRAALSAHSVAATGSMIFSPEGSVMQLTICSVWFRRATKAALAAAVAHVPVVKPLRSGKKPGARRSMALRSPSMPCTKVKLSGRGGRCMT